MQLEHPYLIVAIFGAAAVGLAGGLVGLASLFGQRRPTRGKLEAYECGMRPVGDARLAFPVWFYLVGIMFLLFSLEVIFFIPWAIVYRDLVEQARSFGLIEMGIFLLILLVGYLYVWKRGGFDWEEAEKSL
ncbi:MAG: NADH-quinone oxidoreductase subunit A [Armatimonadota bacterium]|jgi:NADH-quinone oxidoreductase subunit A